MTTTQRNAGPLGTAWTDIGSDVNWTDYGGNWARHIEGTRYHVIRFENCQEWGDGATGYHVDLSEVDLNNPQLESALESSGQSSYANDPNEPEAYRTWMKVEALASYGAAAPLWQDGGTNAHKLLRAARRESNTLARDAAALEERMDRRSMRSARRHATTGRASYSPPIDRLRRFPLQVSLATPFTLV